MYINPRARSVARMKGCSNQLFLASFTWVMEFLRHCPTYCVLGGLSTLQLCKWQYLVADTVLITKGLKRHVPGAPESNALDPGLGVDMVQQEKGGGCRFPESCLKAPLEVVLLWGTGGDSGGVGLRSWGHSSSKQQWLHRKKWLN